MLGNRLGVVPFDSNENGPFQNAIVINIAKWLTLSGHKSRLNDVFDI